MQYIKHKRKNLRTRYYVLGAENGQSSLEVLIALTILVLAISAAIIVGFGNQSATVDIQLNNRAVYLARQELETLRANARQDFSLVASSTSQDGVYTKEITVNDIGTYSKEVTAKLTWQVGLVRTKELTLSTVITDWRTAYEQAGTGDGGGGTSGDWTNPVTAGVFDLGPGNEGTDIAIRNQTVFIVGEASDAKKHDFFSVDVTNINSPSLLASIDTGPGLESIALWNDYAYLASDDTGGQLQVIDISNPNSPALVATSSLLSNGEIGRAVFAKSDYAYIGTGMSDTGAELQIFDVSNPGSPVRVATVEIGDHVNDIYVFKDRAYVATSKADKELIVYDVTNPGSPQELGSYDHAGGTGRSVFVTALGTAHIGVSNTYLIMDTTDLGSISVTGSYGAGGQVNDLYIRDTLAFLGTANNNSEFQVINIEAPANPTLHSGFNFPQVATGVTYRSNVVYVSVRSNDALRIITSTP
jgi:Tfp pilus assembly protein PilV